MLQSGNFWKLMVTYMSMAALYMSSSQSSMLSWPTILSNNFLAGWDRIFTIFMLIKCCVLRQKWVLTRTFNVSLANIFLSVRLYDRDLCFIRIFIFVSSNLEIKGNFGYKNLDKSIRIWWFQVKEFNCIG